LTGEPAASPRRGCRVDRERCLSRPPSDLYVRSSRIRLIGSRIRCDSPRRHSHLGGVSPEAFEAASIQGHSVSTRSHLRNLRLGPEGRRPSILPVSMNSHDHPPPVWASRLGSDRRTVGIRSSVAAEVRAAPGRTRSTEPGST
jgi:hypothetical protein